MVSSLVLQVTTGFDTGVDNGRALLLKIVGVIIIAVGAWVVWISKKGKFADVIGTVAIVFVGLALVSVGVGFTVAGDRIGKTVLNFFGF